MRSKDFLRHYASQFQTVEIDSTLRARLQSFFKRAAAADLNAGRFAVEIRNKDWLVKQFWELWNKR